MNMDEKGFILYEVMLSLFVIAIVTTMIVPSIIEIQNLRNGINQEREAIRLLAYDLRMDSENSVLPESFNKSENINENGVMLTCLKWHGSRGMDHEWCLESIKN